MRAVLVSYDVLRKWPCDSILKFSVPDRTQPTDKQQDLANALWSWHTVVSLATKSTEEKQRQSLNAEG